MNTNTNPTSELHVVFGTGPLGLSVMRELTSQGRRVRMVNRSGHADVPAGVEVVRADAYNHASARQAAEGASVVYQCAQPEYTEWPEKFPPLQASILDAAASHGARFIVGDNLYMYGPVDRPMTEDMPNRPAGKKGRTRARMTEAVMDAHEQGRVRAAIARGADFFGPAVFGSLVGDRVFYPALAGKPAQVVGDLDAPHSLTYINDFGHALAILGTRDEALGHIWHVPNAPAVSLRRFLTMVYAEAGHEPNIRTASKWMVRALGLFVPNLREIVETMYQFEQPFVVDDSRFRRAFGDISTPLDQSIRETVAWFRAHPQAENGHNAATAAPARA